MICTASSSQRSRSPGRAAELDARRRACSVSNHAPPMPRIARPPLMWSSVVAIFATSAGLRNVLAPTMRPSVARSVASAQAASVSQPSKIGPSWEPTIGYRWSQVQMSVVAERVGAHRRRRGSAGQSVYWPQADGAELDGIGRAELSQWRMTFSTRMRMITRSCPAKRSGSVAVAAGEVLDVRQGRGPRSSSSSTVPSHGHPVSARPRSRRLTRGSRLELAVLQPPDHRVHEDRVRPLGIEVEPHDRLAREAVGGVDGQDRVAQLGRRATRAGRRSGRPRPSGRDRSWAPVQTDVGRMVTDALWIPV